MYTILLKSFIFVLIIFLGYGLKKAGFFKVEDARVISKVVINITLPAVVISSFAEMEISASLLWIVMLGFCASSIPLLAMYVLSSKKAKQVRVLRMLNSSGYNIGCFALPLVQMFYGAAGVIPACMFDTGNAIMVTGGTYAFTSSALRVDEKEKTTLGSVLMKFIKSPPFDVYMLMLAFALLHIQLPDYLYEIAAVGAGGNSFLAMLMIGIMMEFTIDREAFGNIISVLGLRLVFSAIFATVIYFVMPFPLFVKQVLTVVCFSPVTSLGPAFTERCGGDSAQAGLINSISVFVSLIIMTWLALAV